MNKTNPERQHLVQAIERRIYELFDSMNDLIDKDGNPTRETHPYWNGSDNYPNLSWIGFHKTINASQINPTRMRRIVRGAIEQSLKSFNNVFVYYCPDNAVISIENPHVDKYNEIVDLFEGESDIPELFVAKD